MVKQKYTDSYPNTIFGEIPDNVIKGIKNGKKSFAYPIHVQIDLTNNCNFNCVGCWCHSELMEELKFSPKIKKQRLSKKIVFELIDDLAENGTKEIQLSGSGEPTTYPYFMDVVRKIKKKGMVLHIVTNFSLITNKIINELIKLKVDRMTISLWAGSAKTYVKTHPNQTEKTFEKIKKNLKYLNKKKKELPTTKIYNVISNLNYHEIEKMIDLAYVTRSDFIEFQTLDAVKGKTEKLLLNKKQKLSILDKFKEVELNIKYTPFYFDPINKNTDFVIFYEDSLPKGFKLSKFNEKVKCKKGFFSNKYNYRNKKNFEFEFNMAISFCTDCEYKTNCYGNEPFKPKPFRIRFLRLLGYGEFYRKLSNEKYLEGTYESNIVDKIPCTIGWTYARILPKGDVIPCCKAHKKPLGNINENMFGEIWNSTKYNEFREKAKTLKKSNSYFKKINCYKSCDNLGMNIEINNVMIIND